MSAALNLSPASEPVSPPANLEAEQALLGILLYDNAGMALLGDQVAAHHFYEPLHQRMFSAIAAAVEKGQLAEPILLAEQLGADPAFEELGGVRYLADLVDRAPPTANAPDYARAIANHSARRRLLAASQDAIKAALEGERPGFELISEARAALEALEQEAVPEDASMIAAPDAAAQAIAEMEELARTGRVRGRSTGLRCIDRRLGGLRPGTLYVSGGRPGMGKTALARAILHGAAVHNPNDEFLFLGIEMGPVEMMQRELSALTHEHYEGVQFQSMAKGALTPFDFQTLDAARGRVPPNLILDDCHSLSLEDVRRKVWSRAQKARQAGRKLSAIVIDYLQLMKRPAANGRNEASVLGEITAGLKLLARQADICIVLLSQLSRAVEQRDDKRPQLSDLRESGSIEQDADAVIFPFREVYYLERAEPKKTLADKYAEWEARCHDLRRVLEVICAKQRQGPVGTDRQRYFAEFDYIEDDDQ